jgi:O-antigen/teichoic acid export membrane protein
MPSQGIISCEGNGIPVIQKPAFFHQLMNIEPVRRQSIIHIGTNIAITAIGFLSTVYFAHVLGPSILGAYFLFLAYFGIFNLIVDGGFGNATAKRISEGKEQEEFFSASAALRLGLLAISLILLFVFRPFLVDLNSADLFWWLVLALVVNLPFGITSGGNYGLGKAGVVQGSILLNNLLRIIIQVVAVFLGFQLAGLAGGFIFGIVIGCLFNYRYLELQFRRFTLVHLKSLFTFSFWIFLAMSGLLVFTTADVVLIGYFLGNADVGIYRVALQLASLGVFIALALQNVLYPRFSRWNEEGKQELMASSLSRAYTYSLVLAVPFCVGGWLLGDKLLYYLYGAAFSSGTVALFILLPLYVVYIFLYLQMMTLNALNHPKDSFWTTAVAVLVNIALNILLIPLIGINGAAVATLVSILVNAVLGYVILGKYITVKMEKRALFHILAASAVMALVVGGIRLIVPVLHLGYLIGMIVIGAVVYFVLLLKIDRGIRDEMREIFGQTGIYWPDWL